MDTSSLSSCSDDDGSIILSTSLDEDEVEKTEQQDNFNQIENSSSGVIFSNRNGTIIQEKDKVQPDALTSVGSKNSHIHTPANEFGKTNPDEEVLDQTSNKDISHFSSRTLTQLVGKAIVSSTEENVAINTIVDQVASKLSISETTLVNKLVLNVLENNHDIFMPYIRKINNKFESGFWTVRPKAAPQFIPKDKPRKTTETKQKNSVVNSEHHVIVDERLKCKPVVNLERLSETDHWASNTNMAQVEGFSLAQTPSDILNKLMNHSIVFEKQWAGWSSYPEVLEKKINKLESFIKYCENLNVCEKKKNSQVKSTSTCCQISPIKSSADNLLVHNEHNYVASKDPSGSKNLIENIRKIVQAKQVGTNCERTPTETQNEEYNFLGFDYDSLGGCWRGWEKASSRNAEKIREIIISLKGSRDLEKALREGVVAVSKSLECLEELNPKSVDKPQSPISSAKVSAIQTYYKELLKLFDHMAEEPPISYLVLTVMAICANVESATTEEDICQFIQQHFPFHCREDLGHVVEVILRLGSPSTFICQKSRRPCNTSNCWRVNCITASEILARALKSAKKWRPLSTRSPNKTTKEERVNFHVPTEENASKVSHEIVVDGDTLISPDKTSHKKLASQDEPRNIQQIQLNGKRHMSPDKNVVKRPKINTKVCDKNDSAKKKHINDIKDIAVPPVPVVLKNCCSSESKNIEVDSPHNLVKTIVCDTAGNAIKKTSNNGCSLVNKEDQELDLVSISNYLQAREKLNFHTANNEDIMNNTSSAQVLKRSKHGFESDQCSTAKKMNLNADKKSKCFFLLRCQNLRHENSQQPCYICHKVYESMEVLNIHLAQKHCGKDNVHVRSSLCEKQGKETNETKKSVMAPSENRCELEAVALRTNIKKEPRSKHSGGPTLYSCGGCSATFHDSKTLDLHIERYHKDGNIESEMPLNQVSTTKFYYCKKCFDCYDTEKALLVHSCF